jgi:hypothetical protein
MIAFAIAVAGTKHRLSWSPVGKVGGLCAISVAEMSTWSMLSDVSTSRMASI